MHDNQAPHRRRVLLLADGLGNGGAERQLSLLAAHLPPPWQARVWCPGDGPFVEVIRAAGVPVRVRARQRRWDVRPFADLWRCLLRWRPHVVHSWGWMCSGAAGPICAVLGIPLIDGTIRAGYVPRRRAIPNRLTMRWAARIIANSRAGLAAWNIDPSVGRVVHNGFDPDRLARCALQAKDPERFTVVMTGRMVWEKDFRGFLAAARELAAETGRAWRFIAVGDGPDRDALLREAADLVAAGIVEFARPGIEVMDILRQADVGVLMSHPRHAEGISNSLMEYMACGLPVVCTRSGGNRELVIPGGTGWIIPPAAPPRLTAALRWLRAHPQEAECMGARGRERLLCDFSIERMVQGMIGVYHEVIAR